MRDYCALTLHALLLLNPSCVSLINPTCAALIGIVYLTLYGPISLLKRGFGPLVILASKTNFASFRYFRIFLAPPLVAKYFFGFKRFECSVVFHLQATQSAVQTVPVRLMVARPACVLAVVSSTFLSAVSSLLLNKSFCLLPPPPLPPTLHLSSPASRSQCL